MLADAMRAMCVLLHPDKPRWIVLLDTVEIATGKVVSSGHVVAYSIAEGSFVWNQEAFASVGEYDRDDVWRRT